MKIWSYVVNLLSVTFIGWSQCYIEECLTTVKELKIIVAVLKCLYSPDSKNFNCEVCTIKFLNENIILDVSVFVLSISLL